MSSVGRILIIEDDPAIGTIVSATLTTAGFVCEVIGDGMSGLKRILVEDYDLVILDLNLPSLDGLAICRQVRISKPSLPVIMLTARNLESDVVSGLEVGADDYIVKPFGERELLARVRSRLREFTQRAMDQALRDNSPTESKQPESRSLRIGEIELDFERMRVSKRGVPVELTAREYELVSLLASHPGRPFTREELLEIVWKFSSESYAENISTMMSRIRKKIEDDPENPKYILTIRGVGYRFCEPKDLNS